MRRVACLLMLALVSATPGVLAETYEGRLLVGGLGAALDERYGEYTGLTGERIAFSGAVGGLPFSLTAIDATGLADVDICFYDGGGRELGCFIGMGDEAGAAPHRSESAFVFGFLGVDIRYTLVMG